MPNQSSSICIVNYLGLYLHEDSEPKLITSKTKFEEFLYESSLKTIRTVKNYSFIGQNQLNKWNNSVEINSLLSSFFVHDRYFLHQTNVDAAAAISS